MGETARAPITTILFTDLVDSTTLMQRAGDERAQRLFETYHRLLSDAVSAHGANDAALRLMRGIGAELGFTEGPPQNPASAFR
jgi:class 3 adenylate cyclase